MGRLLETLADHGPSAGDSPEQGGVREVLPTVLQVPGHDGREDRRERIQARRDLSRGRGPEHPAQDVGSHPREAHGGSVHGSLPDDRRHGVDQEHQARLTEGGLLRALL